MEEIKNLYRLNEQLIHVDEGGKVVIIVLEDEENVYTIDGIIGRLFVVMINGPKAFDLQTFNLVASQLLKSSYLEYKEKLKVFFEELIEYKIFQEVVDQVSDSIDMAKLTDLNPDLDSLEFGNLRMVSLDSVGNDEVFAYSFPPTGACPTVICGPTAICPTAFCP